MQRSIKYGLYGAVVAAVVGAPVAWANSDRTVHLVVDGHTRNVTTSAANVRAVLAQAGYTPRAHDLIAPAADAPVHDGSTVVLRRARQLHLDVDGRATTIWTTATTVSDALTQLGYSSADFVSVSRSRRLPLTPTQIAIRTPKAVTVVHDGRRERVTSTATTVGQLLDDLGITVRASDRLNTAASTPIGAGRTVVITRVDKTLLTRERAVPFRTKKLLDPKLAAGRTSVVTAGRPGMLRTSWVAVYVDGTLVRRSKLQTVVVRPAEQRVVRVGTKPTLKMSVAGSDPSPAALQAYARSLLPSYGWGDDQFSCLVTMWNHESGWRVHAANPSGAYGIPQALPGSKMGPGWQTSAEVQIKWGLGYIKSRYGSPCGAWAFWQQGSWY